jgi:hypothetical protein
MFAVQPLQPRNFSPAHHRFGVNEIETESPIFPGDSPDRVSFSVFVRPRMTAIANFEALENGGFLRV